MALDTEVCRPCGGRASVAWPGVEAPGGQLCCMGLSFAAGKPHSVLSGAPGLICFASGVPSGPRCKVPWEDGLERGVAEREWAEWQN